jgi:dGTPase
VRTRKDFEELESDTLKSYAVKSATAKGKNYDEPIDPYRTDFQRDRDRITHSKAFRRLKHKTQVFAIFEGDHYRTRLTHTLEVAQIARHLARCLALNEDLSESIALAHDLGHTPFGHAGEQELDSLLVNAGGFEHNKQSLRIVERLETKYVGFCGLNLTIEVLEGMMKHKTPFDNPFHIADEALIHPSLEAQVVNLADQLAYLNHDLDDGIASGVLKIAHLNENVDLWREARDKVMGQYSSLPDDQVRFLCVRYLINKMIKAAMTYSEELIHSHSINSLEDVYHSDESLIQFPPQLYSSIRILRTYLYDHYYQHPRVSKIIKEGRLMIKSLYELFFLEPTRLPERTFAHIEEGQSKERVIADYISGMTDSFAKKEYDRLVNV